MSNIPVHNETLYELAPWILDAIRSEVIEYFGESVCAIRIQIDINRHVFSTKTREVRYAFFPDEYGLSHPLTPSVTAESGSLRDRDYQDVFMPSKFTDDADEVEAAFILMGEDIGGLEPDPEAEFQGLDPDFDAIDTADQSFLDESRDANSFNHDKL